MPSCTCDVGTPTVWAARYLQMNGSAVFVFVNHGSTANAMPQALGAQAMNPGAAKIDILKRRLR